MEPTYPTIEALAALADEAIGRRLLAKSHEADDGCWIFSGCSVIRGGYQQIRIGQRKKRVVHRLTFELAYGPIPAGLQIDHLCRVTSCFRPDHLEAVTLQENIRRRDAARVDLQAELAMWKRRALEAEAALSISLAAFDRADSV